MRIWKGKVPNIHGYEDRNDDQYANNTHSRFYNIPKKHKGKWSNAGTLATRKLRSKEGLIKMCAEIAYHRKKIVPGAIPWKEDDPVMASLNVHFGPASTATGPSAEYTGGL
ncbi:hypothetical protein F4778DRAFT_788386 [Xylariomycetidae sp. FL2044]|nr:hypothetical protein F4778DRAFT_788386 [Xylariomycetidae sp. FL2044]